VTNIDREHLDHYANLDAITMAFTEFVNKVPFYGAVVLCLDDENVRRILPAVKRRVITYGTAAQADLRITNSSVGHFASEFQLTRNGQDLGRFKLSVPGAHNVLNATAAIAIALELDVPIEAIREGIAQYAGVDRRFQIKGVERGVSVIDDYGHHPSEIQATLAAARACNYKRVHVLFQPHRFTRTQALMDEFAQAFHQADSVYLLDIYAASETVIPGVNSEELARRMKSYGHRNVYYVGPLADGIDAIAAVANEGDAIITLGAGSVSQAGPAILEKLKK
jgi:UDP-N-acetylmuramate--alanine ligase